MESYTPWRPLEPLTEFFECYATDSEDGLRLMLQTADADGRTLLMYFPHGVPAYRQIVEECRLHKFARLQGGEGQLWIVNHSAWLSEFGEGDRIHYPDLTHYLIETRNQCFDLLADKEPVVTWSEST